jgi:hypothetical protein
LVCKFNSLDPLEKKQLHFPPSSDLDIVHALSELIASHCKKKHNTEESLLQNALAKKQQIHADAFIYFFFPVSSNIFLAAMRFNADFTLPACSLGSDMQSCVSVCYWP